MAQIGPNRPPVVTADRTHHDTEPGERDPYGAGLRVLRYQPHQRCDDPDGDSQPDQGTNLSRRQTTGHPQAQRGLSRDQPRHRRAQDRYREHPDHTGPRPDDPAWPAVQTQRRDRDRERHQDRADPRRPSPDGPGP